MSLAVELEELLALYEQGKYLTAYETATRAWGELQEWQGIDRRVFGGKLAHNLGGSRLGRTIHYRAWRDAMRDGVQNNEANFCKLWAVLIRRGPWRALNLDRQLIQPDTSDTVEFADRLALQSHMYASMRDFQTADRLIAQAVEIEPRRAWIHVERAAIFQFQDRLEDAMEATATAIDCRPFYRPAVQSRGYLLAQLNRDEEALQLLTEAASHLQSGDVWAQLVAFQCELEDYESARKNLERLEPFYPLMSHDKTMQKWMLSRRADIAYHCGDFEAATQYAKQVDTPFFKQISEHLEENANTGKRVLNDVEFVRQDHVTCAPATLTAISKYWKKEIDHVDVAEEICYDGTPAHEERRWAEEQGYVVREFKVTWENAVALLDRGLPFTLATVIPGSAHLQPIIGYDSRRGVLLVRDPSERHMSEFLAEKMLEYFCSTGPRGMVMVPHEKAELLDGIELEDAVFYDLNYQMQLALRDHLRDEAYGFYSEMNALGDDHRLTIYARAIIAHYDADRPKLLECTERLLELFPDDVNQLSSKLRLLGELGRRTERRAMLEDLCHREKTDPMFWQQLAEELLIDSREVEAVEDWVKRSMRFRPHDATNFRLLSQIRWEQLRRRDSMEIQKFAACLEDMNEGLSRTYFAIARSLGETSSALEFLRDRVDRHSKLSSWPARTLTSAFELLDRTADAFEVADASMLAHPDDGELMLFASELFGRYGKSKKERELLERARKKCHRNDWLRSAASYSLNHGNQKQALKFAERVLESEPLDMDTLQLTVQLLSDASEDEIAERKIRNTLDRFNHHFDVRSLLIEYLGNENRYEEAEHELRDLLKIHPDNPWGLRELALNLVAQRRFDEAIKFSELGLATDSTDPSSHHIHGVVLSEMGRVDEANRLFRNAIEISVDWEPAVNSLIGNCDSKADRLQAIEFVYDQLQLQTTSGDGLLSYRDYATKSLDHDELLAKLQAAQKKRADLWQSWVCLMRQYSDDRRFDDAIDIGRQATERFPMLPQVWMELSYVYRAANNCEAEIDSIQSALQINKMWSQGLRELADAYLRAEDLENGKKAIEKAIKIDPKNVFNLGGLADIQWHSNDPEGALSTIESAIEHHPGYEWAWNQLTAWSDEAGQPDRPLQLARRLSKLRPKDMRPWIRIAELCERDPAHFDEAIDSIEHVLMIDPRNVDAHQQKATLLAMSGDFDQAIAACMPGVFGDDRPVSLTTQHADLELQRGNLAEAKILLSTAVEIDPDHGLSWMKMADVCEAMDDPDGFETAVGNMMRVAPHYEVSLGYFADLQAKKGNRAAAIEYFEKSIEASAEYSYGGMRLLDYYLEDKNASAVHSVLQRIGPNIPAEWKLSCEVRGNAVANDDSALSRSLIDLCQTSLESETSLRIAVEFLLENEKGAIASSVLEQMFKNANANAHVGGAWALAMLSEGKVDHIFQTLKQTPHPREIWRSAAKESLELMARAKNTLLEAFVEEFGEKLKQHNTTWSATCEALHHCGSKQSEVWISEWRTRRDLASQQLFPAVLYLWDKRRVTEANVVADAALQLPEDASHSLFLTWRSAGHVLEGQFAEAAEKFAEIQSYEFAEYYHVVYELIGTFLSSIGQLGQTAMSPYQDARTAIKELFDRTPSELRVDPALKYLFKQIRIQLAVAHRKKLTAFFLRLS